MQKRILSISVLAALSAGVLLSACGGSTSTSVSGVFLDSAVEGVDYAASGVAKTSTGADGGFTCKVGETLTFTVGGITLGSASCAATVTPLTLAGSSDVKADSVVNRLLALQLLDEDDDPSNGIKISTAVKTALASQTLDFSAASGVFDTSMSTALSALPATYQTRTVDEDKRTLVREHFEDTLASKLNTPVVETVTQTNALGSVSAAVTRYRIQAADSFYIPYEGSNAAIQAEFPKGFLPSYGSGLVFKGKATDGALEFYGITDRGPNGDGPKVPASVVTAGATGTLDAKYFPSPSFTPSIGLISVGSKGAVLKSTLPIKFSSTTNASGLSIAAGKVGSSGEVPLTDASKYEPTTKTTFSDYGLDTESVTIDAAGMLWVSDEYGPFLLKIDPATGIIQNKYQPGTGAADLPSVLAKRRANRGMEGLTVDASGKLHGFVQSPLDDGKALYIKPGASSATNESIKDYAKFNRWVEFDPTTETTKLYAYPLDSTQYASGKTGNAKLGDLLSLGNGKFILIEQGSDADGKVAHSLMLVEIPTDVTDIAAVGTDLEKSSMTGAAVNSADYSTVVPLKKTLLFDLNNAGWIAEKAEGLAWVDEYTLAISNDDDFGGLTKVFDSTGTVIEGADITKCTVDANGAITTTAGVTGCTAGNTARFALGDDTQRPNRLWLFKFSKKLAEFAIP